MKAVQRLELLKDFVQEAVDRGASSVEQIHQYIADLPFDALEKTGLLEEDKLKLREKQQEEAGAVPEVEVPRRKPAAKKKAAKKRAAKPKD